MPWGLKRYHESHQAHFVTFTCYHRAQHLNSESMCRRTIQSLERTRLQFDLRVFAFVLMPDHVHLLVSEPRVRTLAQAIQSFKISSSKGTTQSRMEQGEKTPLWQKRYFDRNIPTHDEFVETMRYIHRNPVRRGLCARPEDWNWSSFNHYASGREVGVEIESERTAFLRIPH